VFLVVVPKYGASFLKTSPHTHWGETAIESFVFPLPTYKGVIWLISKDDPHIWGSWNV
jgi:hypothetical protein